MNPPEPPAPVLQADVAFALHTLEIANSTLALMAAQLRKFAANSPKCEQVMVLFMGMTNAAAQTHAEMLREASSGVVVASAQDAARLRLG